MSAGSQASIQQSSSTWTEPPWSGWIETTGDALLILEAARRGLIPRVTRRLVDSERKMITSGSVFVFDEDESGIKRWTDGFFWSPSRILGNFLLYRETDKRGAGHRNARADSDPEDPARPEGQSLSRPKTDNTGIGVDKQRERTLMGSLTNSYKFKPDGLMKKTFSVTIGGVAQHLISYYKIEDVENGRLRSPSSLPELASLDISPEYLDKTHFRNPPKVEIGVDGVPRYRGEADDIESSPSILTAPLSSGLPLLTDGRVADGSNNKRGKRYDPYGSPTIYKRARRNTKSSQPDSNATPTAESISPQASVSSTTPQPVPAPPPPAAAAPAYQDANAPLNMATQPPPPLAPYPAYGMPAIYTGYPPPPAGYMYAAPAPHQVGVAYPQPPPPGAGSPQIPPQGGPQYAYPGYPPPSAPPVHGSDPSQAGHAAPPQPQPQPYYSYYPPHPPPVYGSYHYSPYPPQPQPVQHPPPPAQPPLTQPKPRAAGEGSTSGESTGNP